jgi:hypothetical protein
VWYGDAVHDARRAGLFGFVFQESVLFPWLTALANVELPLKVGRPERPRDPRELLELVGLREFAGYYPQQLSGGMPFALAVRSIPVVALTPLLMLLLGVDWKPKVAGGRAGRLLPHPGQHGDRAAGGRRARLRAHARAECQSRAGAVPAALPVFLAREIGACYASSSYVVNWVNGIREQTWELDGIHDELKLPASRLVLRAMKRLTLDEDCGCTKYRKPRPQHYHESVKRAGVP